MFAENWPLSYVNDATGRKRVFPATIDFISFAADELRRTKTDLKIKRAIIVGSCPPRYSSIRTARHAWRLLLAPSAILPLWILAWAIAGRSTRC